MVPRGTQKTSIVYDVYKSPDAADEGPNAIDELLKRVKIKDTNQCTAQQKAIQSGIHGAELQTKLGQGSISFLEQVYSTVVQHYEREQTSGQEIWPARRSAVNDTGSQENILFCSGLDCSSKKGGASETIVDIEALY